MLSTEMIESISFRANNVQKDRDSVRDLGMTICSPGLY